MAKYTTDQLADRWMDRREIQNLMGKFVYKKLLKHEREIFEGFWASSEDICLGVNEGWFKGRAEVRRYYEEMFEITEVKSKHMQELYPDFLGSVPDGELHGVGSVNIDPLTTCVIEQAEDGKTAQGLWYVIGADNDVTPHGPYSMWAYGYMAADFVKEGDDWKIWHLRDIEDISAPVGMDWSSEWEIPAVKEKYAALQPLKAPEPTVKQTIRELYSPERAFTPLVEFVPQPYASFSDTTSYGI